MTKPRQCRFYCRPAQADRSYIVCALYAASMLLPLVGCDKLDFGTDPIYPTQREQTVAGSDSPVEDPSSDRSLIGDLFSDDTAEALMIPVNGHLWRASLDTLSFMPLSSADPFGGVHGGFLHVGGIVHGCHRLWCRDNGAGRQCAWTEGYP